MAIIGILMIYILPFAVGTLLNIMARNKETNQIETYLIGFFSLFFIQGVVFLPTNLFGVSFEVSSKTFTYMSYAIVGLALLLGIIFYKKYLKPGYTFHKLTKLEATMFGLMLIAAILVVVRVILLEGVVREDVMLNTVRMNLQSGDINTVNPLTGRQYELGLIKSKKIITLSTYYTYWASAYGIDARLLLYVIIPVQTVMCIYFVYDILMNSFFKGNRKKNYTFHFFLGILLLSGDYFNGAVGYKVLWNGYRGDVIVGTVMLVYVVHVVIQFYRYERGDYGEITVGKTLVLINRVLMCVVASAFITSVATGVLMLVLALASITVCCTWRFTKEEK